MSEVTICVPPKPSKGPNDHWEDSEGTVHIELTQGQWALVSSVDYPKVAPFRWYAYRDKIEHRTQFYAKTNIRGATGRSTLSMHALISEPESGFEPDHVDGDGLNNRRLNLRNVTHRVNMQNRHHQRASKYPGVSWNKQCEKWRAQIKIFGKTEYLGLFSDESEAAAAYRGACLRYTDAPCILAATVNGSEGSKMKTKMGLMVELSESLKPKATQRSTEDAMLALAVLIDATAREYRDARDIVRAKRVVADQPTPATEGAE
jgi:hypothetical protein